MESSSPPTRLLALTISLLVLLPLIHAHGFKRPSTLAYHGGPLIKGNLNLSILFYGRFGRVQKTAVRTFLKSLNSNGNSNLQPQVSSWWGIVEGYQSMAAGGKKSGGRFGRIKVKVVKQVVDPTYSAGKVITTDFIKIVVNKALAGAPNSIPLVFTARDVTVQGLCIGKCADHGIIDGKPYLIVGNPEWECPGACAWPFHKSDYGPQGMTFQPPSGDKGADSMVVALASGLASLVTNPFKTGFYAFGRKHNLIEATTACPAMFGSGAMPGYTGKVRINPQNGGAFNAHGVRGQKFLLPAIWNPKTSSCWTPI